MYLEMDAAFLQARNGPERIRKAAALDAGRGVNRRGDRFQAATAHSQFQANALDRIDRRFNGDAMESGDAR